MLSCPGDQSKIFKRKQANNGQQKSGGDGGPNNSIYLDFLAKTTRIRRPPLPECPNQLRRQENAVKVLALVFVIAVVFMAAIFVAAWVLKESKDQTEEEAERTAKESAGVTVKDMNSSVHKALIKPRPEILKDLSPEELGQSKEEPHHTYLNTEENAECTEQFVMKSGFLRNETMETAESNVTTEMTNRDKRRRPPDVPRVRNLLGSANRTSALPGL